MKFAWSCGPTSAHSVRDGPFPLAHTPFAILNAKELRALGGRYKTPRRLRRAKALEAKRRVRFLARGLSLRSLRKRNHSTEQRLSKELWEAEA
jgi:hypothetical protein